DGYLILALGIFGEECVRLDAGLAHRRNQHLAKNPLPPPRVETVGRSGHVLDAGVDELMLERREELQASRLFERFQAPAQKIPRAAFPRSSVRMPDVAEIEMLWRAVIVEVDMHVGRWIGDEDQIAGRTERRVADRPECGDHGVGWNPADAA